MSLKLDQDTIRKELRLLYKYDLIEQSGGAYGGVFDRTLKKVAGGQATRAKTADNRLRRAACCLY